MKDFKVFLMFVIFSTLFLIDIDAHAQADIDNGLNYLRSTQSASGNWEQTSSSLNGIIPSTSTALEALRILEDPASPNQGNAILYLLGQNIELNDHLSRLIVSLAGTGEDTSSALNVLLAGQNSDGGWGGNQGYRSNILDTALVLMALRAAEYTDETVLGQAVSYLLEGQNSDGGWGFVSGEESRVYYTALALRALSLYAAQFDLADEIDLAVQYLRDRQNADGGFGPDGSTTFESALGLLALLEADVEITQVESGAVSFIANSQQSNGSWEDDPYSTALALLVLERNIVATLPNLLISDLSFSNPEPPRGIPVSISAEVCNDGQSASPETFGRFYLNDPLAGGGGAAHQIPELAPGACESFSESFDSSGLADSELFYVMVDPEGAIPEANENDNIATQVLQIRAEIANLTPEITSSPALEAYTASWYVYEVKATDLDGDPLSVELLAGPDGMVLDFQSGVMRWLPRDFDLGDAAVEVQVSDGQGGSANQAFTLTVLPGNQPPVISSTPVVDAAILEAYSYQVEVSDPEGETIEFFLLQSPQGMRIHKDTGLIRWIPAEGQEGFHTVTVQVVDAGGAEAQQSYSVNILSSEFGPDLVVAQVDNRPVETDTQSLEIGGTIDVTVGNAGNEDALGDFELLLFYDEDRNGEFESAVDSVLGQATVSGLATREQSTIAVPVSGTLRFRDDLIYAYIDSENQVTEADEENNLRHSGQASEFHPKPGSFSPALEWSWTGSDVMPEYDDVMMTPLVVNLNDDNGDGQINEEDIPDVVFVSSIGSPIADSGDGILRAISGKDGSPIWDIIDPELRVKQYYAIAAGDLDGDGLVEIVARAGALHSPRLYSDQLLIFEHDGTFKQAGEQTLMAGWSGAISIADMEHDGSAEIIIGHTVFHADGSVKFVGSKGFFGSTVNPISDLATPPVSMVGDLDLDGQAELITGFVAYRADGSIYYDKSADPDFDVYYGPDQYGDLLGGYTALANFNDDPYPEIVIYNQGSIALLDHTGELLWQTQHTAPANLYPTGPLAVADFDGDGLPEIGIGDRYHYGVIDQDGSILWQYPIVENSGFVGSSVFDFEGDGVAEVLYADTEYLRVFRGTDGKVLFQTPNPSGTFLEFPVVADVDNDGRAEIIVSRNQFDDVGKRTGTFDSGIFVYGDQLDNWVGTRRIWNQHGYYITNINEDGTIPQEEVPNWQVFNNLRQNEQLPNEAEGQSPYAVADLTASLIQTDDSTCPTSISLSARIGNGGGEEAPAGVLISFYDGDPDLNASLIGTVTTSTALVPGEFEDVSISFPDPLPDLHLLTAIADDGGGPLEVQSDNLLLIDGTRVSDYDNFEPVHTFYASPGDVDAQNPTGWIYDGIYKSGMACPLSSARDGEPGFIEISFPYPVNVSGIKMMGNDTNCSLSAEAGITLSNGFTSSIASTCDSANRLFSSSFAMQRDIRSLRLDFSGDLQYSSNRLQIGEIAILGSYLDPTSRQGSIAEGREDNNRALFSTALCGVPPSGNLAPEILSSAITEASLEIPYLYDVLASDRDGDPLSYALVTAPAGMTIDPSGGSIRWTPQSFQQGDFPVSVEVSDDRGGVTTQDFVVTVSPVNAPPEITSTPPTDAQPGVTYNYDVEAIDPEGTTLSYSLTDKPSGMNIEPATGQILWRPSLLQIGSHSVSLLVRDMGGEQAEQHFSLTISPAVPGVDLIVSQVDNQPSVTETQSLDLSGQIQVSYGNAGDTALPDVFEILLFADENENGSFDTGIDSVLGSATHSAGLEAGEFVTHDIPVSGSVLFRDNLIYAFVDSADVIPETDEGNNLLHSGMSSRYEPSSASFSPQVERTIPLTTGTYPIHAPLVANLTDDNGDGAVNEYDIPEIIFMDSSNTLRVIDGASGTELWSKARSSTEFNVYNCIPAVGDLDEDGVPEIIIPLEQYSRRAIVLGHDGSVKFVSDQWPTTLSSASPVHLANLDRQGPAEILIGNVVLNADGTLRFQGSGGAGLRSSYWPYYAPNSNISTAADLDLAGDLELVAGNTAYRSDGTIFWQNTAVPDGWTSIGNLDDDAYPEIVLVDDSNQIRILEHDGSLKYGPVSPPGGGRIALAMIADFDGDGDAEIGISANSYTTVFEADLTPRWSLATGSGFASAFDFEGDGQAEILVYRGFTFAPFYFRILSGADGSILYEQTLAQGARPLSYPVAADVDNDGNAEILLADKDSLLVLGDPHQTWSGTRRIWNQLAYHITHINEDGSIPLSEEDNIALFNNFLQNPSFDFAPDLTASKIVVEDSLCPDSVQISARIGNGGGISVPAGVPVTFLEEIPGIGHQVLDSASTSRSLQPGEYEDVDITLDAPAPGVHGIVAAADLQTRFDNLCSLSAVSAEVSFSTNSLPADRLIDGNSFTDWCTSSSFDPAPFLEVTFPYPVNVSSVTLYPGPGSLSYSWQFSSGTLSFSNGFELPVSLQDGGGSFSFPRQEGITSIRFSTENQSGCLTEFVVGGGLGAVPEYSGPKQRIQDALLAHWPLDGSGEDLSGNEHHAALQNDPTSVPGLASPALQFDGQDDYVMLENFTDFPGDAFTVTFWLKTSDDTKQGTVFSYAYGSNEFDDEEFVISNYQNFQICNRYATCFETGVSANDGEWHHIVLTWDSSSRTAILHKDGVQVWSGIIGGPTDSIPVGGTLVFGQEQDFPIGGGFQTSEAFLGILDEVKMFTRVLTSDEVDLEYNSRNISGDWQAGSTIGEGREDNNVATLAVELCADRNNPPAISSAPISSTLADTAYSYDVEAEDPDGDSLAFSLLIAPTGMSIDDASGLIQWTPALDQLGIHTISVQVSDGLGGLDLQTYTLTVDSQPVGPPEAPVDADGDGFPVSVDCDDTNPQINPAAIEIQCSGVDEDCNPATADTIRAGDLLCTLASDQASYADHQDVLFSTNIQNMTPDTMFMSPSYSFSIENESGESVFSQNIDGQTLAAGASGSAVPTFQIDTQPPGEYSGIFTVSACGDVVSTCSANFTLLSSVETGTALEGTIQVDPETFSEGESATISYSISNVGNVDIDMLEIGVDLINLESGEAAAQYFEQSPLLQGETYSNSRQFVSDSTSGGAYMAMLFAKISATQVLDGANFTILAVNESPTADDQSLSTDEDTPLGVTLTASDADDDTLTYIIVNEPQYGTLSGVAPDLTYTPDADYHGPDSFTFQVNDGMFDSNTATVSITVNPINDAPVLASIDDRVLEEGSTLNVAVSASDPDGDPLILSVSGLPDFAAFTDNGDGTGILTLTPDFDDSGVYSNIEITVSDGALSDTEIFSITINNVNRAPVADDQSLNTDEDTVLPITLTASDPDGDVPAYIILSTPDNGTLSGTAPDLSYTPNPGYNGPDSFTFQVTDGTADSNVATVNISVGAVNDPPLANDQSVNTDEDTPVNITLSASDPESDPLTFAIVTDPAHGTLSGTAPDLTYTPNADYSGPDSFTFKANDGILDSNTATISITVNSVNDPPVLAPIGVQVLDEGMTMNVTISASDPDGDLLTLSASGLPAFATLADNGDGTGLLTLTPGFDDVGDYPGVEITVSDGGLTDTVAFTITVNNINRAPVTEAGTEQEAEVGSVVLLDGSASFDPDGDVLSFSWKFVSLPSVSLLTENDIIDRDTASPSFTPDVGGDYILQLNVSDGQLEDSDIVTIHAILVQYTLTVQRVGDGIGTVRGDGIECGNRCNNTYEIHTVVTLLAEAAMDSVFVGWSVADCGIQSECTIVMDADTAVSAIFRAIGPEPTPTPVIPEPTTVALLGVGLLGVLFLLRRRRK